MLEYALFESIAPLYKYPVLCRKDDEGVIIPLIRLVPVQGEYHDEALKLLKRCLISIQMLPGEE